MKRFAIYLALAAAVLLGSKSLYAATKLGDLAWQSDVDAMREELESGNRLIVQLIQGTNVLAVVTNYDSQVNAPLLSLQYLDGTNGYRTVWSEERRHGMTLTNAMEYADSVAAKKADRAWSKYTSARGADAPDDTTWISTSAMHIAGGYEYEKAVTSSGSVYVLCTTGMDLGVGAASPTNSFLSISAVDGTPIFTIEKTDAYLAGADPSAITTVGSTCVISVPIVADSHPFARVSTTLKNATWYKEDADGMPSGSPASVTWSGSSGAWVATVDFGSSPQGFCYFEVLMEGETKIVNHGLTDLTSGVYFNGHRYTPSVSGNELKFTRVN